MLSPPDSLLHASTGSALAPPHVRTSDAEATLAITSYLICLTVSLSARPAVHPFLSQEDRSRAESTRFERVWDGQTLG